MPWPYTHRTRPRALIAGGGVAALEACLSLRARLPAEDLEVMLLATGPRFEYRPLAVMEAFAEEAGWSLRLEDFAADCEVTLVDDALVAVGASAATAVTASGATLPYDVLLVAVGGRPVAAVPGALTFRGPGDVRAFRSLLEELAHRPRPRIAFATPTGATWPLPLYELALMTATELRARGAEPVVVLTTPQPAPLSAFGDVASAFVERLLAQHEVELEVGAEAVRADDRGLELADGRVIGADAVVALPQIRGRRIEGLPRGEDDFVDVDAHGRVTRLPHVYAAGDVTSFALKHGSLAAQQADAAAEAMLAELGLPIVPRPFRPVLHGVLHNRQEPAYLRQSVGSAAAPAGPRTYSLWWPPGKVAGEHLSPYLAIRAGAPRTPEWRPDADIVPISVEVGGRARRA